MNRETLLIENTSNYIVEIIKGEDAIKEAKDLDDLVFKNHQGISIEEMNAISEHGGLIGIRNSVNELIAEAQIIFYSIPSVIELEKGTGLCYGSAVHPSYRKLGLGQVLMKAKIQLAVDKGFKKLTLSVRPENAPAILLWQKFGFSIYGYDSAYFGSEDTGGRLLMEKYLTSPTQSDPKSNAHPKLQRIRINTGDQPDQKARLELKRLSDNKAEFQKYHLIDQDTAEIAYRLEAVNNN